MDLAIWIQSNRELTEQALLGVGRAYDRHPELRPNKVGDSEPFRTRVKDSMASLLEAYTLPLSLLGVSKNTFLKMEFSTSRAALEQGLASAAITNSLFMKVELGASPSMSQFDDVALLFRELCAAVAADIGYAMTFQDWLTEQSRAPAEFLNRMPNAHEGVLGIVWMHYFGRDYVSEFPELGKIDSAAFDATGGLSLQLSRNARSYLAEKNDCRNPAADALAKMEESGLFAWTKETRGVPGTVPGVRGGGPEPEATDSHKETSLDCDRVDNALMEDSAVRPSFQLEDIQSYASWSTTMDVDGFLECWSDAAQLGIEWTSQSPGDWVCEHAKSDASGSSMIFSGLWSGQDLKGLLCFEDDYTIGFYICASDGLSDILDNIFFEDSN